MMNSWTGLGRLGKDPELTYTQGGTARCKFSMVTSKKRKDQNSGEMIEKSTWHTVVTWGKQAENCSKFLKKGDMVLIENGEIDNYSWDDQKSGEKRYATQIIAHRVVFMPNGRGKGGQQQNNHGHQQGGGYQGNQGGGYYGGGQQGGGDFGPGPDDSDIPF